MKNNHYFINNIHNKELTEFSYYNAYILNENYRQNKTCNHDDLEQITCNILNTDLKDDIIPIRDEEEYYDDTTDFDLLILGLNGSKYSATKLYEPVYFLDIFEKESGECVTERFLNLDEKEYDKLCSNFSNVIPTEEDTLINQRKAIINSDNYYYVLSCIFACVPNTFNIVDREIISKDEFITVAYKGLNAKSWRDAFEKDISDEPASNLIKVLNELNISDLENITDIDLCKKVRSLKEAINARYGYDSFITNNNPNETLFVMSPKFNNKMFNVFHGNEKLKLHFGAEVHIEEYNNIVYVPYSKDEKRTFDGWERHNGNVQEMEVLVDKTHKLYNKASSEIRNHKDEWDTFQDNFTEHVTERINGYSIGKRPKHDLKCNVDKTEDKITLPCG